MLMILTPKGASSLASGKVKPAMPATKQSLSITLVYMTRTDLPLDVP